MTRKALMFMVAVALGAASLRAGEPCGPACQPDCEKPKFSLFSCFKNSCKKEECEKECIRVEDKKKVTHTKYSCLETDACKDACTRCKVSLGKKKCGECPEEKCDSCDKCGKPRTVRKLVKRFEVEEKCATKCVPVIKQCPTVICPAPVPAPATEKLPVKPAPVDPMKKL